MIHSLLEYTIFVTRQILNNKVSNDSLKLLYIFWQIYMHIDFSLQIYYGEDVVQINIRLCNNLIGSLENVQRVDCTCMKHNTSVIKKHKIYTSKYFDNSKHETKHFIRRFRCMSCASVYRVLWFIWSFSYTNSNTITQLLLSDPFFNAIFLRFFLDY